MEMGGPSRPRVSRETRLLFITVLVAIVALWVLARIRFPDQPATPNPVPQLLTQLTDPTGFEDLAVEVAGLESRLASSLVALEFAQDVFPALRIHDDVVIALLRANGWRGGDATRGGSHRCSGATPHRVWPSSVSRRRGQWRCRCGLPCACSTPATCSSATSRRPGTSLRPVFVGSLYPAISLTWSEPIWAAPAQTDLSPGAFVFTSDGILAGLAIEHDGRPAILPAEAVIRLAERLVREGTPRWRMDWRGGPGADRADRLCGRCGCRCGRDLGGPPGCAAAETRSP